MFRHLLALTLLIAAGFSLSYSFVNAKTEGRELFAPEAQLQYGRMRAALANKSRRIDEATERNFKAAIARVDVEIVEFRQREAFRKQACWYGGLVLATAGFITAVSGYFWRKPDESDLCPAEPAHGSHPVEGGGCEN